MCAYVFSYYISLFACLIFPVIYCWLDCLDFLNFISVEFVLI